jgi:hypothetical protein
LFSKVPFPLQFSFLIFLIEKERRGRKELTNEWTNKWTKEGRKEGKKERKQLPIYHLNNPLPNSQISSRSFLCSVSFLAGIVLISQPTWICSPPSCLHWICFFFFFKITNTLLGCSLGSVCKIRVPNQSGSRSFLFYRLFLHDSSLTAPNSWFQFSSLLTVLNSKMCFPIHSTWLMVNYFSPCENSSALTEDGSFQ